jgi:hypothetical protein
MAYAVGSASSASNRSGILERTIEHASIVLGRHARRDGRSPILLGILVQNRGLREAGLARHRRRAADHPVARAVRDLHPVRRHRQPPRADRPLPLRDPADPPQHRHRPGRRRPRRRRGGPAAWAWARPSSCYAIRIPLAWPVIIAGVRVSTQLITGVAAIAVLVGGGGLGSYIQRGLTSLGNPFSIERVWTGTVFVILLALVLDAGPRRRSDGAPPPPASADPHPDPAGHRPTTIHDAHAIP